MSLAVRDPRTGRTERYVAAPSLADLDDAVTDLREAQVGWERRSPADRADALLAWKEALEDARDDLVAALVADTGRLAESEFEHDHLQRNLARWSRLAPRLLEDRSVHATATPSLRLAAGRRPYPLVGVIGACSYPLVTSIVDAVPALIAGCAVLVKPSEITPRFIEPLNAALQEVPDLARVLRIVEGAGNIGAAIVDRADAVAFTGSARTGRKVAAAAAGSLTPTFLELGGTNPAIVLHGSDLDHAAREIVRAGTVNSGQSCLSIERIYVEAPDHDALVDRLVALAERLRLAYPEVDDGDLGPFIDADQADVVARHLAEAVARGATLRCGHGVEWLDGGAWCAPTVLTNVDHSMFVMNEETFGPVLAVMAVENAAEAVGYANDSAYGYAAAVFADEESALSVARQIEAGTVAVNESPLSAWLADGEREPFKGSGLGGPRGGPASLTRFLRRQSLLIGSPSPKE